MIDRRQLMTAGIASLVALAPRKGLAKPEPGSPAPLFNARDTAGRLVELSALKGSVAVLEWTNHQCPFVGKHYGSGNMQALQRQAAALGAVWIAIISSGPGRSGHVDAATANRIAAEQGAVRSHTVLDEDGVIGRRYDARTTPHMAVIDAAGMIAFIGGVDDIPTTDLSDIPQARNFVRAALEALAAGREPAVRSARPYGCVIRYAG